jgi:hypothetical protein
MLARVAEIRDQNICSPVNQELSKVLPNLDIEKNWKDIVVEHEVTITQK